MNSHFYPLPWFTVTRFELEHTSDQYLREGHHGTKLSDHRIRDMDK